MTADRFRTIRRTYDWWGTHPVADKAAAWLAFMGRERYLRRKAVEEVGIKRGDTVLDLGCGTGTNFPTLERALGPTGTLIAFDYDPAMLKSARLRSREEGWRNVWMVRSGAARLMLPETSLDGAVSTLAMSVVPDHLAAMRRVHHALKPGARFVVMDAKPFTGTWQAPNPLIVPLFEQTTAWHTGKDLVGALRQVFPRVRVQIYNLGSSFIAVATKAR